MAMQHLQSPIVRRFIETVNEDLLPDLLALFAPDAIVIDGPPVYPPHQGHEAIARWAQQETFDLGIRIQDAQEKDAAGHVIEIKAIGHDGFIWHGTLHFSLRHDLIERLVFSSVQVLS